MTTVAVIKGLNQIHKHEDGGLRVLVIPVQAWLPGNSCRVKSQQSAVESGVTQPYVARPFLWEY